MKEGDILFYRTDQDNDWVGIFDHISDEPSPGVYNKVCVVAGSGDMCTSIGEYVKRGSYRLCSLCGVEGFRAATPDEVGLLMNVLEKNGYYYDEEELKVKRLSKKPNFQYGDFIYTNSDSNIEWLSIFEKNSDTEVLTVVDYSVDEKCFYTDPACPHGRLTDFNRIKECRLMTSEEKEVLVKALAKKGYRWNEEKKELEQIPVELKEPKFKPFEKVLVRDCISGNQDRDEFDVLWHPDFFGSMCGYKYLTTSGVWDQCIRYEGNEDLLGTNKSPKK